MSIEVRNVRKSFGNFVALDNVSLDFPSGDLVALLGPSGCGKTTLLRVIAGLESADSGHVILQGQNASATPAQQRQVGFVFQHYALFRHMTVFENVAFGLRCKPRKHRPSENDIRRKVNTLLELVQLAPLAQRWPSQLSGGQRQRVALARALAIEPRLLLLDEPFGALDAKVRKELRRWLRALHDELHITTIFVTHDQEEALELADHVVLMNHGRVEQVGSPSSVYFEPRTPFVYGFLGAANQFHGRIEGQTLQLANGSVPYRANGFAQGTEVVGFVRPHELKIHPAASEGVAARISRILEFGAVARVELINAGDSSRPQHFEVELPREEIAAMKLSANQTVNLVPLNLSVFELQGGQG